MTIAQNLLPEFDHEMANTRKVLALVGARDADWRPHPKSFTMGQLALHVANLPNWCSMTIQADELDLSQSFERPAFTTTEALLQGFDRVVAEARSALAQASDADLKAPWTLRNGSHVIFTLPRIAVLRSMVMSHLIHHRAQLTVYLRLRDLPVPGLYGPSADER